MTKTKHEQKDGKESIQELKRRLDIRVFTYNMRVEFKTGGGDPVHTWARRLPGIADSIERYDADIIGTQELRAWQLDELMKLLGSKYKTYGVPRYSVDDEHCAIIYNRDRFDFIEGETRWLSKTPKVVGSKNWDSSFPRIVTYAILLDKINQKKFVVFNTHLDHQSSLARRNGLSIIVNLMLKYSDYPVILTGDFNMHADSDDFEALNRQKDKFSYTYSTFQDQLNPNGKTYHGFQGGIEGKPIDFIYYSLSKLIVTETSIIYDKWEEQFYLSDHYPVYSVFRFIKE